MKWVDNGINDNRNREHASHIKNDDENSDQRQTNGTRPNFSLKKYSVHLQANDWHFKRRFLFRIQKQNRKKTENELAY